MKYAEYMAEKTRKEQEAKPAPAPVHPKSVAFARLCRSVFGDGVKLYPGKDWPK